MKELPNYEYHSYEKLDHTNVTHRLLLESYIYYINIYFRFWKGMVEKESVVDGLMAHYVSYFKWNIYLFNIFRIYTIYFIFKYYLLINYVL